MMGHLDFQIQGISLWRREVYLGWRAIYGAWNILRAYGLLPMSLTSPSAYREEDNRACTLLTKRF